MHAFRCRILEVSVIVYLFFGGDARTFIIKCRECPRPLADDKLLSFIQKKQLDPFSLRSSALALACAEESNAVSTSSLIGL